MAVLGAVQVVVLSGRLLERRSGRTKLTKCRAVTAYGDEEDPYRDIVVGRGRYDENG